LSVEVGGEEGRSRWVGGGVKFEMVCERVGEMDVMDVGRFHWFLE